MVQESEIRELLDFCEQKRAELKTALKEPGILASHRAKEAHIAIRSLRDRTAPVFPEVWLQIPQPEVSYCSVSYADAFGCLGLVAQRCREVLPTPDDRDTEGGKAPSGERTANSGMMSAGELLDKYGLPPGRLNALQQRLKRWRKQNGTGWVELPASERGPRDAHFIYRLDAVKAVLDDMKGDQRTSVERTS